MSVGSHHPPIPDSELGQHVRDPVLFKDRRQYPCLAIVASLIYLCPQSPARESSFIPGESLTRQWNGLGFSSSSRPDLISDQPPPERGGLMQAAEAHPPRPEPIIGSAETGAPLPWLFREDGPGQAHLMRLPAPRSRALVISPWPCLRLTKKRDFLWRPPLGRSQSISALVRQLSSAVLLRGFPLTKTSSEARKPPSGVTLSISAHRHHATRFGPSHPPTHPPSSPPSRPARPEGQRLLGPWPPVRNPVKPPTNIHTPSHQGSLNNLFGMGPRRAGL